MAKEDTQFKPGVSGNPNGRPIGAKGRKTIPKELLGQPARIPDKLYQKLLEIYPNLKQICTIEESIYITNAFYAMQKGNVQSALMILDSAYGKPQNEVDEDNPNDKPQLPNITINITKEDLRSDPMET